MSAPDEFVTAALTDPPFPDPQSWICMAVGLPYDVLTYGAELEFAVLTSMTVAHNRIYETFFTRHHVYATQFILKPAGAIDPRPRCQGFYAALNLNRKN